MAADAETPVLPGPKSPTPAELRLEFEPTVKAILAKGKK
jgi:hypothetical protein